MLSGFISCIGAHEEHRKRAPEEVPIMVQDGKARRKLVTDCRADDGDQCSKVQLL